jgi:benzoyl-CoA reductase/2-hydroxyglutaryl-CoA dehydratase subunit BcrC/BadD/HgdB
MFELATNRDSTYLHWAARNWSHILRLGIDPGPLAMLKMNQRYKWMSSILKANQLMARLMGTRQGAYRQATGYVINKLVGVFSQMARDLHRKADRLVWHEYMVPPEILFAMDLMPFMTEMFGMILATVDNPKVARYVDEAENSGIPVDTCMMPRHTLGMLLAGELPPPLAIVSSNSPCDGGMSAYSYIERHADVPIFRLDVPHRFREEKAIDYYLGELDKMIAFLEENTPGRMDWDRLLEICEERNRAMEYELELWDLMKHRPAPLGSDVISFSHMVFFTLTPGQPIATKAYEDLLRYANSSVKDGGALEQERFRILLWNPPIFMFPDLFSWAEREYGANMVMDMFTFNRHPLIDTSSRQSMLRDLATIFIEGPMARHTLGPVDYFFDDLFFAYEHFAADAVWMTAHIGCKNTQALLGMLREKCRDRGIPLLIIDVDSGDQRVVSVDGVKEQVTRFMETVMVN